MGTGHRLDSTSKVSISRGTFTTIQNDVYGVIPGQRVDMLVVHINAALSTAVKDIYAVEKEAHAAAAEANTKRLEAVGAEKVEQQTKMQEEIEEKLKTEAEALPEGEELNES